MRISVVLDCHDPKSLVEFWSTAMGYRPVGSLTQYEVLAPAEGEPAGPVLSVVAGDARPRGQRVRPRRRPRTSRP